MGFNRSTKYGIAALCVFSLLVTGAIISGVFSKETTKRVIDDERHIDAYLLQTAPDEFVVLTEQELNEYPVIREAITSQSIVKVRPDEWQRTYNFLGEKGSYNVKYDDGYYAIGFMIS